MDSSTHRVPQRRIATSVALAVMLTGALVSAAWLLGRPDATRLVSASSSVRFTTGLCFLLGGNALLMVLARRPRVAFAMLLPVMLLAAPALLEYATGFSLVGAVLGRSSTPEWLLMAPNTAVALALAGLATAALLLGGSRIWALGIASMLATLSASLGLVAALGYAFDLTAAFEWAGLTRMALLTALALVALGAGIVLAAREVGRIAPWLEQPWLASSVGAGAAALGVLAARALSAEVGSLPTRIVHSLDVAAIAVAILLAGAVAQARHTRLLMLRLAAANRRQAEQAEQIADLYENAPCGYHSLDGAGRFVRINRTELDWLGYGWHELVGRRSLVELLTPESRSRYEAHFARFKEHGSAGDLELELQRKDGSVLPVVLSETAVCDARGVFRHSRSTLFDNSERRRLERSLRESEQRLQHLIDSVPTAVVVHAGDSSIEYANPHAADLLGCAREQLFGRRTADPDWHFLREDGTRMPVEEYPVSRVLRSGQPLHHVVAGIRSGAGQPLRWVLVDAVPATGPDGRVRQVVVSFTDISERQQQKRELELLASTDSLTGLATRRHLLDVAGHELARARRSGRTLSVVAFDLDQFKSINDRFGHATGDHVLRRVGELLHRELREMDLAARWGGEEFCLLLPETDDDAAAAIAERLRVAVERLEVTTPDGRPLPVTASFGVAQSSSGEDTLLRLLDAADQAMYQAKRDGRNRVAMAQPASATA